MWCIQYIETAKDLNEAEQQLDWLEQQVGFLGGRILMPGKGEGLRTQVFFEDAPSVDDELLPDGCRRVWVSPSMSRSFRTVPNAVPATS